MRSEMRAKIKPGARFVFTLQTTIGARILLPLVLRLVLRLCNHPR